MFNFTLTESGPFAFSIKDTQNVQITRANLSYNKVDKYDPEWIKEINK
jgi:hypothetical protein